MSDSTITPVSPTDMLHEAMRADLVAAEREVSALRRALWESNRRRAALRKALGLLRGSPRSAVGGRHREGERHCDYAERILFEAGVPMRVGEIARAMEKLGHRVPKAKAVRYSSIHASLSARPGTFVRVARGLWALRKWADPPNDTTPERKTTDGDRDRIEGGDPDRAADRGPMPTILARG